MKAIITIGCSASGKSTFANMDENDSLTIERDYFRELIVSEKKPHVDIAHENLWTHWNFKWEDEVTEMVNRAISQSAQYKLNIIISDTNINKERRSLLNSKLEELGYEVEEIVFGKDLTLEDLWNRDLQRKNSVGHTVIAKQYQQFRKEFPLYELKPVDNMPSAIIVDVDGTLAHMYNRSPYQWDKVQFDNPDWVVLRSVVAQYMAGYKIIVMSGRDSVCRDATKEWLDFYFNIAHNIYKAPNVTKPFEYELYMREKDDQRSDVIVKKELFMNHVDGKYYVEAVFDDRPKVIRLWQDMGFKVISCGNPYIEF